MPPSNPSHERVMRHSGNQGRPSSSRTNAADQRNMRQSNNQGRRPQDHQHLGMQYPCRLPAMQEALAVRTIEVVKDLMRQAVNARPEAIASVWDGEDDHRITFDDFYTIMTTEDETAQIQLHADDLQPDPMPVNVLFLWARLGWKLHCLLKDNLQERKRLEPNANPSALRLPQLSRPVLPLVCYSDYARRGDRYYLWIYWLVKYIQSAAESGWLRRDLRNEPENVELSQTIEALDKYGDPDAIDLTEDNE